MEKFSFFNDVDGDRVYYAEDFARHLATYFTNGIFNNGCQVLGNNDDMSVNVNVGSANINGYRYDNDAVKTLSIDNADGVLNRIDNIVIRLDLTNRNIITQVIKGTPASSPVAPDLTRTSTIYDLRIAKVSIPAGTTEITQDLITDTRFITSDCGNVISTVETPDTEQLFIQIQQQFDNFLEDNTTEFDTWFNNVKGQLSTDVAGNLQNEIDAINTDVEQLQTDVDILQEDILPFEKSRTISNESVDVYKPKNGDAIESESVRFNDYKLSDILGNKSAGYHNSIYRGNDITARFYDGSLSSQIANDDFTDIFIGDYIIGQSSGRKYLVADINYRLHCGDTECTTPHILMIPEKSMGTAQMNATNTASGAYIGSAMYKSNLTPYKTIINNDFGSNHILSHRNHLMNSITGDYENGGAWYNSTIELMNELMVYGSNIFHNVACGGNVPVNHEVDKAQLSLFRLDKSKIVAFNDSGSRQWYWLRNVSHSGGFCIVSSYGISSYYGASASGGVRPCFLIY